MAGWTDIGKYNILGFAYRASTIPTNFYMGLWTSATTPDYDTETFGEGTEIAAGNGYATGGYSLTPGATDFDVWTNDGTNHRGLVQCKDIVWTASGGSIPASGNGARYALLIDDNGTVGSRVVYHFFDLVSDRSVSDTQTLTLQDCEIRINES